MRGLSALPERASARLAPFVPSPQPMIDAMLELAGARPGDTVYDLGAGDGQIVLTAAQRFGARAVGIEIDDELATRAAARIVDSGLRSRASIVHGDFLDADIRAATIVTLYQLPSANELLRPVLDAQLRPGARVVSLDFPVPGWSADRVSTTTLPNGSQHAVYVYSISSTREDTMAIKGAYQTERLAIELDGVNAGFLRSSEGGCARADVVTEKLGTDQIVHKHIAGVRYDDISVTCGGGMSKNLYSWIEATLSRKYARKNGAIIGADANYNAVSRLSFYDALLSGVTFPALDASSKDTGYLTVNLTPEYTRREVGKGKLTTMSSSAKAAALVRSNFRLQINGLDCSSVSAIDAITIRQTVTQSAVGALRDYEREPAALEIPNLAVTLPEAHADSFFDWLEDFVIKGNNGAAHEKTGTLEYGTGAQHDVLFTLTFYNLGIFRLVPMKVEPGSEMIRRVRAEMYCEEIVLQASANAVSEAGTAAATSGKSGKRRSAPPERSDAVADAAAWKLDALASSRQARPLEAPVVLADARVAAVTRGRGLRFRS